ncbi:efflux transporter outer membrane subunit [Sphingomonas nostoxanthinifaciens]|uniref:efflux transporter outer membrane subunit n=1 Tax=Sphingomonas nostoxanthinifaciens TaxID=2872652 RepID=UPI001CC204C4|nr:efflux transporter outer membrane subunit [Sphingomonas nostoxanthinifaciens]UAK26410.1 efflux transporter outer membrane subunit [Sphingomonas nostoxanthinifaciens]
MKRRAALLALLALSACNLEPHLDRPQPLVPPSWPAGDAYLRQNEASLPSVSYRDIFKDPNLQAIIDQALANNQDLREALANVAAARATYRVQRADLFPQVNGTAGATDRHTPQSGDTLSGAGSGTGSTGTGSTGTGTTGTGSTGTGTSVSSSGSRTYTTYQLQAGATSWELDLFGRVRSLTRSALDLYLSQEATARGARLTLVAEIANAYLQLASDRSLLAIALDTQKSALDSVRLTQARLDGGVAPRTDLRQAQTVLATAQADTANVTTLVAQDRNALELLVGARVADALLPPSIEAVDGMLGELPAGLDSTILLRRPDVVQTEYELRAANARIGAARAAFLPRISLTGLAGLSSTALSSLFTGGAFTWTVAPSATLPIFDGGVNSGNLAYAKAQRDLYLATYQKAIQTAFREVADALARRGTIDAQIQADQLNLTAAQDTYTLDTARYRNGIDPYLNALVAQRTLYDARRTLASARLTRAQNLVALYQTLGGDALLADLPDTPGARRDLEAGGQRLTDPAR